MLRKLAYIAAISSALWLSAATALSLGEIEVKSRLNQKFSATIPLPTATAEEADNLSVSLAGNDDFQKAGIERSEFVTTLAFNVNSEGAVPRIEITSKGLAREPYITFLISVSEGSRNRILREYTVLLDPPEAQQQTAAKPAPAPNSATQFYEPTAETPAPAPAPAPTVATPPTVAQPAPAPGPGGYELPPSKDPAAAATSNAAAQGGSYGPVQTRETLWSIATRLRAGPSVTMDQALLAIFTANPKAFDGGSINGLRRGSVLRVPTLDEQRAVSAGAAKARVAELRGVSAPVAQAPLYTEPVTVAPAAPVEPPKSTPPKPVVKPTPAPVPVAPTPAPTPPPPAVKKPEPKPAPPPVVAATPPPAPTPPPAAVTPPPAVAATPPPAEPVTPPPAESTTPPPAETPATAPAETPPPEASSTPPVPPAPPVIREEDGSSGLPLELIGGLVLLLLLGAGGFYAWRKRQQQETDGGTFVPPRASRRIEPEADFEDVPPAKVAVASAAASSQRSVLDELEKLESSLGEEPVDLGTIPAAKPPRQMESPLAATAQFPQEAAPVRLQMDPSATAVIDSTLSSTAKLAEKVDFDVTGQFESDTVSINLDTNDPVAEADFHLAYGLYDEAALLLIQAAEKDPGNTAVRVKLAEVYFAAGKGPEFQRTAEGLKDQLPPAEWQKLAILGQQIAPDAAIFQGAGAGAIDEAVDLSFDEPVASTQMIDPGEATMVPQPKAAPAAAATQGSATLDFKLEDFNLSAPEAKPAAKASSSVASTNSLEFSLDVPEVKAAQIEEPKLELDLASFDLEAPSPPAAPKPAAAAPKKSDNGMGELRLEDFDVSADSAGLANSDAAGTKLDLARAYMDMDKDMARTLLEEVLQQGNSEQKAEAQALMSRVG